MTLSRYILVLILVTLGTTRAQTTYWIAPADDHNLAGFVSHFNDTTARLSIRQVMILQKQQRFSRLSANVLNQGYTASNHWLHVRLNAKTPQTIFIELDNPRINEFWFYQIVGNTVIRQVRTGDTQPFTSRGFRSANWVFPVLLAGEAPTDLFIMVAKRFEVLGVRINVWEPEPFEQHDRNRYLFWGLITGFSLLILLINAVALAATKEGIYFWFICLIVAIAFHISAQSGLGFQYIWPKVPAFNRLDPQLLSGWLIMLAHLQFMQQFIGQKAEQSRAFHAVRFFKVGLLTLLVLNIVLRLFDAFPQDHFQWTFNGTLVFTIASTLLAFWSIFERIHQRENVVIFYTITFSIQLIGYLLVFAVNLAFTRGQEPLFMVDSYVIVVINFLFDLLILTSGILFFWFQNYRRQNEKLLTALHLTEQAQSQKIIEALEIERNRIAEDLYDDVGAMLSTAISYLSSALRKPEIKDRYPILREARALLDRSVENLRTVSHNLMPKNFAQLGLARSLSETLDKVADTSPVQFDYIVVGTERRLQASTEVQVFRIASELINDVLKNSTATQATVQLVFNPDYLNFIVEDNGPRTPAYNNLTSKVNFIHGKLDVDTTPYGVTAVVQIPYQ